MPPQEHHQAVVVSSSSDDDDDSSSVMDVPTKRDAQRAAQRHNTPTPCRCTFHWELNLYTVLVLALVYRYVLPAHHHWILHTLLTVVALGDGLVYYIDRGHWPGVPYTFPFVTLLAMLWHPVRFWAELGAIAMESGRGVCTNVLGWGTRFVFVTDTALCRQIFTGEGVFQLYAHPNALWLFGAKNLIYMPTEAHKQFRKVLSPALFGKEALEQYAECQERVCRRFLERWSGECRRTGRPVDVRLAFRSMAAASSQEAFLGPYLTDELRESLEKDILAFTMGFLSFPFPYFNSGLHQAIQAKNRIEATMETIVPQARAYIRAGHAPRCLMERWCQTMLEAQQAGTLPACMEDDDVARTVLDFLFAAQDATNSALVYSLDVLDENRYVLHQLGKNHDTDDNNNNHDAYVAKIANKLLHHKPPVPMVPHIARQPTVLAGHKIRKGTILIPSITYAARTSGQSRVFDGDTAAEDAQFVKTVTFGAGQHKCPGRRYAESLLVVFLKVLAQDYDFWRVGERPTVDEFIYFPTCFPKTCDFMIQKKQRSLSSSS